MTVKIAQMVVNNAVVIRTSDHNGHAQMLDATRPNVAEFCRRHKLELREFRGLKRGQWDWHACFNRLYMFEELIAEGHSGWVIYLDTDAYIVDLNFPIADYLDAKSEYAGVLVHSGAGPACWDVNNGVMFLNLGHPVASLIVRDWIRRHENILNEVEYLSEERPYYFGDQRILQHVLRDNPSWFGALHIETQDLMNSMHATFIRHHIRAITPDFDRRLALIRQDVDAIMRVFPADGAARPGTPIFNAPDLPMALQSDPTTVTPASILLEGSSFCQLRCPSCPTATGAIDAAVGRGFLRFEDFRKLVEANPSVRRIELSNYGEVFLNPELLQILEFAHRSGVTITIDNGANLNHVHDDVLEGLVKHKVNILRCSIDGASAETYQKYRVRGHFDAVISNIRRINHFKHIHRSEFPRLGWQFIVFGYNEHELPRAREMAASLGMDFHPKLTWDAKFSPVRDTEMVKREMGLTYASRAEYTELTGEIFLNSICHQLWDNPQINWDGKILGCCRNFWGEFGGNAFLDGLSASVNSEGMKYARDMLLGRKPARDGVPCTSCEIYCAMSKSEKWLTRPTSADDRATSGWSMIRRSARWLSEKIMLGPQPKAR